MTDKDYFAYWDLIAQEAYMPNSAELLTSDMKRFESISVGRNIWMFGCNPACEVFINDNREGYTVSGILDNAESRRGSLFNGIKVYNPSDVKEELTDDNTIVVIALRLHADAVYRQLKDLGVNHVFSLGVLLSGIEPYRSFIREISEIKKAPVRDERILIESLSDFDGNTGALYSYLRSKSGKNRRFIWILKERKNAGRLLDKDDIALCPINNVEALKEYVRLRASVKWEIWECDPIQKVRPDQINIFLQHYGMGYKQVAHLYSAPDYVDYVLTTTPLVYEYEKKSITYGENTKVFYGELPRNDELYTVNRSVEESGIKNELGKITQKSFDKVVLWAPTLRESRYYNRVDSDIEYPFGISLIYKDEDLQRLDSFLKKKNMLLVIKPHPRQKQNFKDKDYGNILYLSGEKAEGVQGYGLLAEADALITDYSSIVFDYMLLDRPIAWVLEDKDHYKIEYLMEDPDEYMPGDKIFTMEDIFAFLEDIYNGSDKHRNERRKICELCNPPFEGKGCEKLAERFGL